MERKQDNRKKRITPSVIATIGAILALIGGFFLSYNYIQKKKVLAFDYINNVFYSEEDSNEQTTNNTNNSPDNTNNIEQNTNTTNYIGYLEIPKINLKKGFTSMDSPDNDVEKNIFIVEGSNYPDVDKGNMIIAGHSGSGWKAFFNDLYKLSQGDKAIIKYNNKVYTYKITNIYKQKKTGTIAIYRNYSKTTLTLVTCTNNNNTSQTVYISELESITDQ